MTETKHEAFERIRDGRLPKAEKAVELLCNLGQRHYESTEAERREVIARLQSAVDAVAESLGIPRVIEAAPDTATADVHTPAPTDVIAPAPARQPVQSCARPLDECPASIGRKCPLDPGWFEVGRAMMALLDNDPPRALEHLKEALSA